MRQISAIVILSFTVICGPLLGAVIAGDAVQIARLYDLMQIRTSVEIMREEGLQYALESEELMLGSTGSVEWAAQIHAIYDVDGLEAIVVNRFSGGLGDADLVPLIAYFETSLGQKVVSLELSARRAFLTSDVEQNARASWRENPEAGEHYLDIQSFIQANDLIERNVMGTMNSNFRFLRALLAGKAEITEAQILADIWGEEDRMRLDASEWVNALLTMAYAPLSTDEMQANLTLWQSASGQALNVALFAGFDGLFEQVSQEFGLAVAQLLAQQDL